MQLHHYQQIVLDDLQNYLRHCREQGNYRKAYGTYWDEKPTLENGYTCPTENRVYTDNIVGIPHVCVKVPTAGGKTFIACSALEPLFDENLLPYDTFKAVVWLVPSTTILKQTYDALNNPRHPYRLKVNELFGSRVAVYKADELLEGQSFRQNTAIDNLNIFVLSYQSIRAKTKEDRRIYGENGALMSFFDDVAADADWLMKEDDVAPYSLINVIRKMQPIVVIDEAHNAMSDLSKEMLQAIRPRFILELTATPRKDKKKENYVSNIISYVSSAALKQANMVKLPLLVYNQKTVDDVYSHAVDLQRQLEAEAKQYPKHYVRPIVLLQAQPKNQQEEKETFDKIKQKLLEKGIKEEEIKIKTALIDEISDQDLMSDTCVVRYIITIDALKEGWDCPFAYILASVANKTSEVAIEQIIGRVLRKPRATEHPCKELNLSYVITCSRELQDVLKKILAALNGQGFSKEEIKIAQAPNGDSKLNLFSPPIDSIENTSGIIDENISSESENHFSDFSEITENEVFSSEKPDLEAAAKIYIEDKAQINTTITQGNLHTPNEAKADNIMASIKKEFKNVAKEIRLPVFHFRNEKGNVYELHKGALSEGFELKSIGYKIDFDNQDLALYEFDIWSEKSSVAEGAFEYRKASEKMQMQVSEMIAKQSPIGQFNSIVGLILKAINHKEIKDLSLKTYIEAFIQNYPEKFEDIKLRYSFYAKKMEQYILQEYQEHAAKNFDKWINTGKISLEKTFTLSETIKPIRPESGIAKSLYEKYHGLNGDESTFVIKIAGLENVLFWHKFGTRTSADFCINGGYMNHYPDFLIVTRSGNYIIVETKGNHLDNSDTKSKIRLGEKWAKSAGANYQYFVAFAEKDNVEGAVTFKDIINIVKNK